MAYLPKQLPEDEENQFGRVEPSTPSPVPQPGGGGSAGEGQGGAAPGVATPTQFGSNAAKLTDYLNANKEQVGEFGGQIAGKLGEQYNTAKNSIDQGFQGYNQEVGAGYNPVDQNKVGQALQDPFSYAQDPNNVSQFQGWFNNQYTGPQNVESWQPYQGINKNVNEAVQNAGLTNNFSGLSTYLNNFMGAGTNTQGMNTLDTALLTRNPQASQSIKQAAKPFESLSSYLSGKVGEGNTMAQNTKQQAEQSRDALRNQFTGPGGAIPTIQNDLTNRLAQTRAEQGPAVDKALQSLQNGTATPEQLKLLGFNPQDLSDVALGQGAPGYANALQGDYGVETNWNSLFNRQSPDVVYGSPGSVATHDEIARTQALGQLTGQDTSQFLGATSPTGQMVNPSRQGLQEMYENLTQRDRQTINQSIAALNNLPGDFGIPEGGEITWLSQDPNRAQMMVDSMAPGSKSQQTLANAFRRMGFNVTKGTYTPPVQPSTRPGTVSAS